LKKNENPIVSIKIAFADGRVVLNQWDTVAGIRNKDGWNELYKGVVKSLLKRRIIKEQDPRWLR